MSQEEFRRAGHEIIDWIADYLADPRKYPVLPNVKPGQLTDSLPPSAPEEGEPLEAIFEDFKKIILPATTHWNHPRFMAYFACTGSAPAILAEALAAALNSNALLWKTAPSVTELEQVTLGWLRQWLGLPEEFFGIIYDTASVSSLHAVAAAREMAAPEARVEGAPTNLTLYTSEQAHSSIEKAAIALGIGQRNVRKIAVDAEFRMIPEALEQAVARDIAAGLKPFCAVATVGTTSTTSVDPVPAIADIAEKHGLWLHVDAAYAGPAAILPEFRHILDGAARAHSLVTNPHKWLFTPSDLSAFYTRRPDILRRAFSLIPEYLMAPTDPRAVNLMEYGIPLGRRFRALKLWFILRFFGRRGIEEVLRSHIEWTRELAAQIDADPRFERVAPAPFSVVCFRYKGTDQQNQKLLDAVNASGQAYLSHTVLNGRFVLRIAIGNLGTTRDDVQEVWMLLQHLSEDLLCEAS
jgi:aromatic-L-amino-acid decarboxylase